VLSKAGTEPETLIYTGQHSLPFYPALKGQLKYLPMASALSVEIELTVDFLCRLFVPILAHERLKNVNESCVVYRFSSV
jgi:hypothetical protein